MVYQDRELLETFIKLTVKRPAIRARARRKGLGPPEGAPPDLKYRCPPGNAVQISRRQRPFSRLE